MPASNKKIYHSKTTRAQYSRPATEQAITSTLPATASVSQVTTRTAEEDAALRAIFRESAEREFGRKLSTPFWGMVLSLVCTCLYSNWVLSSSVKPTFYTDPDTANCVPFIDYSSSMVWVWFGFLPIVAVALAKKLTPSYAMVQFTLLLIGGIGFSITLPISDLDAERKVYCSSVHPILDRIIWMNLVLFTYGYGAMLLLFVASWMLFKRAPAGHERSTNGRRRFAVPVSHAHSGGSGGGAHSHSHGGVECHGH